jgi:hypothetical protein
MGAFQYRGCFQPRVEHEINVVFDARHQPDRTPPGEETALARFCFSAAHPANSDAGILKNGGT